MIGFSEGLALLAVVLLILGYSDLQRLKAALRRQSEQLDSIRAKLGIIEPSAVAPEIQRLLQEGRKIGGDQTLPRDDRRGSRGGEGGGGTDPGRGETRRGQDHRTLSGAPEAH